MLTIASATQDLLEALYVARVATTAQLRRLAMPHRQDRQAGWEHLAAQRRAGLVDRTLARNEARWHLTPAGYDAVESWGNLRPRLHRMTMTPGRNVEHALAVNDVHIAFAAAARARGDECGALDVAREVAHPLVARPGRSWRHWVVADAVVRYGCEDGRQLARFIELDRGTEVMAALIDKLLRYDKLAKVKVAHDQAWQHAYLGAFPRVAVVVAPSSKLPTLAAQERRAKGAAALYAAAGGTLDVSCSTLAELVERGPWAPVFWRPGEDARVDVVGALMRAG